MVLPLSFTALGLPGGLADERCKAISAADPRVCPSEEESVDLSRKTSDPCLEIKLSICCFSSTLN